MTHRSLTITFTDNRTLTLQTATRAVLRGHIRTVRKAMKTGREFVVTDGATGDEVARGRVRFVEVA